MQSMKRGWFIGDFEPSVCKTQDFEVAYMTHHKGQIWEDHYHKVATEINYVIRGKLSINGEMFQQGDIFVIEPGEIARPQFFEDCELIVVKTPCVKNDKYVVDKISV